MKEKTYFVQEAVCPACGKRYRMNETDYTIKESD